MSKQPNKVKPATITAETSQKTDTSGGKQAEITQVQELFFFFFTLYFQEHFVRLHDYEYVDSITRF